MHDTTAILRFAVGLLQRVSWQRIRVALMVALFLIGSGGCSGCSCSCLDFGGGDYGCSLPDEDPIASGSGGMGGSSAGCQNCGSACCEVGEACVAGQYCADSPGPCNASVDCPVGFVCDFTLTQGLGSGAGESGGGGSGGAPAGGAGPERACAPSLQGRCAPQRPPCELESSPACLQACALPAATELPALVPLTSWGDSMTLDAGDSVPGSVVVLPLDDNDCDGAIDQHDAATLLFMTAATTPGPSHGVLHAHTLVGGQLLERWTAGPHVTSSNDPLSSMAAARHDGESLVVVCTTDGRVRAYDGDGNELWLSEPAGSCASLVIADLDADGALEVVSESQVLDAETGEQVASLPAARGHGFAVADVLPNGAGQLEIATANKLYDAVGNELADAGAFDGFVGLADFDGNGLLEVVVVDPTSSRLSVWYHDGIAPAVLRSAIDLHAQLPTSCTMGTAGASESGGPPTLADVTGDGVIDVGVATARGYVVLDGMLLMDSSTADADTLAWSLPMPDCDGGVRGSTAFDFDGDGAAELIVATASALALLSSDGGVLESHCHSAEPSHAHPLVADFDGDGFADLLAGRSARSGASCSGMSLVGIAVMVPAVPTTRTRARYTDFHYRVADWFEDSRLWPWSSGMFAAAFRANPATRAAPDLVVEMIAGDCSDGVLARVTNEGRTAIGAGRAQVSFKDTPSHVFAEVPITVSLSPGASVLVRGGSGPLSGMYAAEVGPLDGADVAECISDNNASEPLRCP